MNSENEVCRKLNEIHLSEVGDIGDTELMEVPIDEFKGITKAVLGRNFKDRLQEIK